jgi:hypothetical protein
MKAKNRSRRDAAGAIFRHLRRAKRGANGAIEFTFL